jgi:hypothetical protein
MDIIVAIFAFLLTGLIAILGAYVSFHPPKDNTQERFYMGTFIVLTILAAAAIGYQAYLGRVSSQEFQHRLEQITSNTEPPPQHTHISFEEPMYTKIEGAPTWPFKSGDIPEVSIGYKNVGSYYLDQSKGISNFVLAPASEVNSTFSKFTTGLLEGTHSNYGTAMPPNDSGKFTYVTVNGPKLTAADIKKLARGTIVLLAMGRVKWHDLTGWYQTDFCEYEQSEHTSPGYSWRLCDDNAVEKKIDNPD